MYSHSRPGADRPSGTTFKLRTIIEIKQVVLSAPSLVLRALTIFILVIPLIYHNGFYDTPNCPLTQFMVDNIKRL